ncbi:MAG: hypothetical protein LBP85_06305, partial [Prevotellaceae bacterium]|nr:hypothetical protein [Prevotellaceae bacterium]
ESCITGCFSRYAFFTVITGFLPVFVLRSPNRAFRAVKQYVIILLQKILQAKNLSFGQLAERF